MNKKLLYVVIAVVVLLLLCVGAYFLGTRKSASPTAMTKSPVAQSNQTPEQTQPASNMKTLKDLLAAGTSQKCTYSDSASGANISGTSYISAGKIRADFSTTTAGQITGGHMITDGKTNYVWMDGQTTGFKMSFDLANSTASGNVQQGVDPNKAMNYSCASWTVDNSLFIPPTSVKFSDFGAVMPKAQSQCGVCDTLTGDSKDQCRTALKCN